MSKPDTWMPLYVGDYIADTMHLNTEQHGAYLLLLMTAWNRGGKLPSDDVQLALICRADKKAWSKLRDVVLPFFELEDGQYVQRRLLAEYARAVKINDAQKANGAKGGRPKKTQTETQNKPTGFDRLNPNETPSPSPKPLTSKPIASSSDLTVVGTGEELSAAARFAVAIRAWEKNRGKMATVQPHDPRLQAWADAGVSDDQLSLAYEWAVSDRDTNGDVSPINAGFLDVFVAKVLKPVTGTSAIGKLPPPKQWFMTSPGIEAKAVELGISQRSGEQFYQFKARVFAEAGVTEDQVRKAKIDAGERV